MNSTALRAEELKGNGSSLVPHGTEQRRIGTENTGMTFKNGEHENFYYGMLKHMRFQDCYHRALVYVLGISGDTRRNFKRIYDVESGCVRTECLQEGWLTSGSGRIIRMAFNLYCNGSLAVSLGIQEPDKLDVTLVNILEKVINDEETWPGEGIIRHEEGIDFIPANIELAGLETALVNIMSRETVMRQFLQEVRGQYDYILIDCMPSLGMITINALVAADYVLVPVEAACFRCTMKKNKPYSMFDRLLCLWFRAI